MFSKRIAPAALILGASALVAGLVAMSPAPQRLSVSGVSVLKYSRQQAAPAGDPAGPVLLLNEARGSNRNTGTTEYMANADVTLREIADLTRGNGPHQGYITMAKGADTTISQWHGKVSTTMGSDQQPVTRFEGTWSTLQGAGRYAGATGHGTYRGKMLSPTEYAVEFSGDIELSRSASR